MPGERSQQAIAAEEKLFDLLGGQIEKLNASNWPSRTRPIFQPTDAQTKFNDEMSEALHLKLGVPRSLVLSPSQVDKVAKELKLSENATKYLHEVAKEGPIDEGLLKVVGIEKPQVQNFPFDKMPDPKNFSLEDARDFIKFISAADPSKAVDSLSKRSVVGHLLRGVENDHATLRKALEEKYGFTSADLKKVTANDKSALERMTPILSRLHSNGADTPSMAVPAMAQDYAIMHDFASNKPGFMSSSFKKRAWPTLKPHEFALIGQVNPRRGLYDNISKLKLDKDIALRKEQEDKAIRNLQKNGLDPDDAEFYTKHGKNYSPRELATILENGPTQKGLEGDIELVTALEQARSQHEQRTGERVFLPPVYETTREDPYRYPGLYTAPTSDQTKAAWDRALETSDEIFKDRALEQTRLQNLIAAMKGDPDLSAHLKPSLDVINRIPEDLKNLKDKYFNKDLESSPVYQKAMERNRKLYKEAEQEIDERTKNETIPAIRGRYMSHGPGYFQSPSYKSALLRAEKDRQQRLDALRLKFEQQGHEQGLQGVMSTYPLEQANVFGQHDAARQGMTLNQELWKANRARRTEEEELEQRKSQRNVLSHIAEEQKLSDLGQAKTAEQNRQIQADMLQNRMENPRQKVEDTARLLEIERGAPTSNPYQAAAWPMPPQIAPSGMSALGTAIPALYAATQPQQQQQPVVINMGSGGRGLGGGYAKGGVVNPPVYNEMLAQQMAAIQNFIEQKNRHQGMPVPSVDPSVSTMGSMAKHMGAAMGPARTGPSNMFGAWAQGMGTHPEHQNAYLEKQYTQSLKNADLEKILSDLRKDVVTGQREREHYLSVEDLKSKELQEMGRHNLASEGISSRNADELTRYHDLMDEQKKEEKERKSKELTPQQMKLIDEHEKAANVASHLIAESAFLVPISETLNTGGNMAKHLSPYNLGAVSFGNTGKQLDYFSNRTNIMLKYASQMEEKAQRTNMGLRLNKDAKMSTDLSPETNAANGMTVNSDNTDNLLLLQEAKLRDGLPFKQVVMDTRAKYNDTLVSLTNNYEHYFKTHETDEEKKELLVEKSIEMLNKRYDKILTNLEKARKEGWYER